MKLLEELKQKKTLTRSDIAQLLASIGKPGAKREQKKEAVRSLGKTNYQQYKLELTLDSYLEY